MASVPCDKEDSNASDPLGPVGYWPHAAVIQRNHFVYKSLSDWSFNVAVGCAHACRFCYVPSAATIKQGKHLARYSVHDPDLQWGEYVLLRTWDEGRFLVSLAAAERTPASELSRDGNRAVMYCTTTDPYQVLRHKDPLQQKSLSEHGRFLVRRSLELIRDRSTLNVRVLTRSPMARLDFELFRSFGTRLVFGMSLPTLRNDLAKVYEPKAPAPSQRLATLQAAKAAGLHVYVAVAPTYPDCDEADLRATLEASKALDPITIFHEPINLRAENAARIADGARRQGIEIDTAAFASREAWSRYALASLKMVWRLSAELGVRDRVHLWPDKALGARQVVQSMPRPQAYERWLRARWDRVSEWPG